MHGIKPKRKAGEEVYVAPAIASTTLAIEEPNTLPADVAVVETKDDTEHVIANPAPLAKSVITSGVVTSDASEHAGQSSKKKDKKKSEDKKGEN